jgi:hypothetical protein
MCDCEKFSIANKRTGAARKNKSLKLMYAAIAELKESGIKPTIMQVAKILRGHLGITTVKKYWRLVNPRSAIDATASPAITNECKYTEEQLPQSNALLTNGECNKTDSDPIENFVELYIKEWNLKILRPKYFELICNGNKNLAIALYQRQFRPVQFCNY